MAIHDPSAINTINSLRRLKPRDGAEQLFYNRQNNKNCYRYSDLNSFIYLAAITS